MTIIMGKKKLNWAYILQARKISWYLLNYLATQKKTYPIHKVGLGQRIFNLKSSNEQSLQSNSTRHDARYKSLVKKQQYE